MRILEFENHHFGVEDIKEALTEMGHELTVVSTPLFLERASEEFDKLFEEQITGQHYDAVFSFNYVRRKYIFKEISTIYMLLCIYYSIEVALNIWRYIL